MIGQQMRAGLAIVNLEARRDNDGHPILYELPGNDGGGRFEIAGINERYHPEALWRIKAADPKDREKLCAEYIEQYTLEGTGLRGISLSPGTRFYLLDTTFNRGPGGSAWIVQQALRKLGYPVQIDGQWGPKTRAALEDADDKRASRLLDTLRSMRERYEIERVGRRDNLWKGLVNRWDRALVLARRWNEEELGE